jgi:hypothetical protein
MERRWDDDVWRVGGFVISSIGRRWEDEAVVWRVGVFVATSISDEQDWISSRQESSGSGIAGEAATTAPSSKSLC